MTPIMLVQQLLIGTPYKAQLFGSRANGTLHSKSDWDILITGPNRIDPILLMNIEERIEAANFLENVDIVDFATTSGTFKKELKSYLQ